MWCSCVTLQRLIAAVVVVSLVLALMASITHTPTPSVECPVGLNESEELKRAGSTPNNTDGPSRLQATPSVADDSTATAVQTLSNDSNSSADLNVEAADDSEDNLEGTAVTGSANTSGATAFDSAVPAFDQRSGDTKESQNGADESGAPLRRVIASGRLFEDVVIHHGDAAARHRVWLATERAQHHRFSAAKRHLERLCLDESDNTRAVHRGVLFHAHGAASGEAGWRRLFFIAVDSNGRPTCRAGDRWAVSLSSPDTQAIVDVVVDRGQGLYEVQALFRRGGDFRFCVDLVRRGDSTVTTPSPVDLMAPGSNWAPRPPPLRRHDVLRRNCPMDWDRTRHCFHLPVNVTPTSAAMLDAAVRRRRLQDPRCQNPSAFRGGEWRNIAKCTGSECRGDLSKVMALSGGWVWLSDSCVVTLYGEHEAWEVLSGEFVLTWSDSTVKQTALDLVEGVLGSPLLQNTFADSLPANVLFKSTAQYHRELNEVFRSKIAPTPSTPLPLTHESKFTNISFSWRFGFRRARPRPLPPAYRQYKPPGTHAYRKFDSVVRPPASVARWARPLRWLSVWQGCPDHEIGNCPISMRGVADTVGVRYAAARLRYDAALGRPRGVYRPRVGPGLTADLFSAHSFVSAPPRTPLWPTVVLVNHWAWWNFLHPMQSNTTRYIELSVHAVRIAFTLFVKNRPRGARVPLLVWSTATALQYGRSQVSRHCSALDWDLHERYAQWEMDRVLTRDFPYSSAAAARGATPAVRIVSRYEVTAPWRYGTQHAAGMHYGHSYRNCRSAWDDVSGRPSTCLHKAFVDQVFQHAYTQAVAAYQAHSDTDS